jgi:hypothetical protein
MERGREAIKTKHVVGSLQGHRTPHSPRRSPLNLCALIVPSPNPGRPPDSRPRVFLLFPDYFNPSVSTSSLLPHPLQRPGRETSSHTHLRTHLTSLLPFAFSSPHDLLNFPFIMATHGPINGVKINRACSRFLVHICARTRFSLRPLARIGCSALIPFLAIFWLITLDPPLFALTSPPPLFHPSALCWNTSLLMLSSRSHRRSPEGGQSRCL